MPRAEPWSYPIRWFYTIRYGCPVWFRNLFRPKHFEDELDEELSFHLERQVQEDAARGMDPAEARRRALAALPIARLKQKCRDVRHINPLEELLKDAVFAIRTLRKAPVFAVTAVITLALGLSLSASMFSVTNAVLLRRLPYTDPGRLVVMLRDLPKRGVVDYPMTMLDFLDIRSYARSAFEDLAAVGVTPRDAAFPKPDGGSEQVHIQTATPNLLSLVGAKVALGRNFTAADSEDTPGAAILSYAYWKRRYDGDETIVGRSIPELHAVVVGVLEPGFELLLAPRLGFRGDPDIWVASQFADGGRNAGVLRVIGRLRPGVSLNSAQSLLAGIAAEFEQKYTVKGISGFAIRLETMRHYLVSGVQTPILVLTGAMFLLLLIASANVANLLLVRTSLREREFAMRSSLGGSALRLTRQLLAEALVLVGIGTLLGTSIACAAVSKLQKIAPVNPSLSQIPRLDSIRFDSMVCGFIILVTIGIAVVFAVVTAARAVKPDVTRVLRSNGVAGPGAIRNATFRNCIIGAEIALAFVLLTGAGLMFRSFLALKHVGLGYDARSVLIFRVTGPRSHVEDRGAFLAAIQHRLERVQGVEAVTSSTALPLAGGFEVVRWGRENEQPEKIAGAADYQAVRPGYFEAIRTPLLAGRTFAEADNSQDQRVVILDELFAAREFPNRSAIGKRLVVSIAGLGPQPYEVIGVVAHQRVTSLAETGREQIYSTEGLGGHPISTYWLVRTDEDQMKCGERIRDELANLDKDVVVSEMQPMAMYVERAEASTRFSLLLIGVVAALASLLTGVGLYGVLATMVRQRSSEIGIRVAMGATPASIFRLVVRRGITLSIGGLCAGFLVSLVLTRTIASMLIGVSPSDPLTFGGMASLFFGLAVIVSWLPARRASLLDPVIAVRE